mgnify:CR=1 FL=1
MLREDFQYGDDQLSQCIHTPGQLALQVAGFVFVNDTTLGQLVDHCDYLRQLFAGSCFVLNSSQVADSITGSLSVIAVSFATFSRLTHIFLCCLMISHVLEI